MPVMNENLSNEKHPSTMWKYNKPLQSSTNRSLAATSQITPSSRLQRSHGPLPARFKLKSASEERLCVATLAMAMAAMAEDFHFLMPLCCFVLWSCFFESSDFSCRCHVLIILLDKICLFFQNQLFLPTPTFLALPFWDFHRFPLLLTSSWENSQTVWGSKKLRTFGFCQKHMFKYVQHVSLPYLNGASDEWTSGWSEESRTDHNVWRLSTDWTNEAT